MKLRNPKIILTFFSVLIGILISTQLKVKVDNYVPATIDAIQGTKAEIDQINLEIESLKETTRLKETELKEMMELSDGNKDIIDVLSEDIKKNKMSSGNMDLIGPGISIKMYDNPEERMFGYDLNKDVIHDIDILNIINDLRLAGAEAISINDERVISTSEVKCGGPIIRINERSSGTPFEIKAIGDPKLLMASITAPGTNGDILKNVYNKGFDVKQEDELEIESYSGIFNFKYAKPLGEGE